MWCVAPLFGEGALLPFAPSRVPPRFGRDFVQFVVQSFAKSKGLRSAVHRLAEPSGIGGIAVYDLTVDGCHEFFADGILVHNSTDQGGCYTAGVLMARAADGSYYVEDVVHGQWAPGERNDRMKATALKDRARYGPSHEPTIWVEAEGGSSGRDAWLGVVRCLEGFTVREAKVTGSKDVRAEPWSAQLAAGNVFLVDNGHSLGTGRCDWDIAGFVQEHIRFKPDVTQKRLGGMKDRVDGSSGAFNILCGGVQRSPMRVLARHPVKKGSLRLLVSSRDELAALLIEERSLLVNLVDPPVPEEVMSLAGVRDVRLPTLPLLFPGVGEADRSCPSDPPHHIVSLADQITVAFPDLDPAELQDCWAEPVLPWGLPPADLVMTPAHGKQLWAFLLKKRDPAPACIVLVDGNDRRALSVAMGICDCLGLKPCADYIYRAAKPDECYSGEIPNRHVYAVVKAARHQVVGS